MIAKLCTAFFVFTLLTHSWVGTAGLASEVVDEQADHTKPVKVYVMLGPPNMLDFGRVGPKETIGSKEFLVKKSTRILRTLQGIGSLGTMSILETSGVSRMSHPSIKFTITITML